MEGLQELPLAWKTEWEAQGVTNARAVGGGAATDLEFRVYRESSGVRGTERRKEPRMTEGQAGMYREWQSLAEMKDRGLEGTAFGQ